MAGGAILIPAGGQNQGEGPPPPHVAARLERAAELWKERSGGLVIVTGCGTPHKPCPLDGRGFPRTEASDNARYLLSLGVSASDLREECVSLDTIGNAYYSRLLLTDPLGLSSLTIVNSEFHMPRTKAIFDFVFGLPLTGGEGPSGGYQLQYEEVPDRLDPEVKEARLAREAAALPRFVPGGPWQSGIPDMQALHRFMQLEHMAYSPLRFEKEPEAVDPKTLKSY